MSVLGQAILSEAPPIADGAEMGVEAVVREHSRLVFKIAYSVVRNQHDTEDVAQETFMRFVRARKSLVGIKDCRAYLARTAWRVAVEWKKRAPEISLDDAAEAVLQMRSTGALPEEIMAMQEAVGLVERLIETLPSDLRATLALSTVEDL